MSATYLAIRAAVRFAVATLIVGAISASLIAAVFTVGAILGSVIR